MTALRSAARPVIALVVIIAVVLAALGIYSTVNHGGGCTVGFADSSATVTLTGPGGQTYCPTLLASFQVHQDAHFYQPWEQPSGSVACTANLNGDLITVRSDPSDSASLAVANAICSSLPSP